MTLSKIRNDLHRKAKVLVVGKFNPNHDPANGQFTSGPGGSSDNTADKNQPTVRVNSRTEITITNPDGSSEIRTGGSRSWRNNNPGNLVAGTFADNQGAIGEAGGFAVFPDEEAGQDASTALLQSPAYSGLTVNQAIARRSPPDDNNTVAVQSAINKIGGFTGGEVIGNMTPDQLGRLTSAIQKVEGWWSGTVRTTPVKR